MNLTPAQIDEITTALLKALEQNKALREQLKALEERVARLELQRELDRMT